MNRAVTLVSLLLRLNSETSDSEVGSLNRVYVEFLERSVLFSGSCADWRKTKTRQRAPLLTLRWRRRERICAPLAPCSDTPSSFLYLHKPEQTSSWISRTKTRCITAIWPPEVDRSFVSCALTSHGSSRKHAAVCRKRQLFTAGCRDLNLPLTKLTQYWCDIEVTAVLSQLALTH